MSTLLIRDAAHVETFDDADRVLQDASIFVRDGAIEALGPAGELPREADRVVDARGLHRHSGAGEHPSPLLSDVDARGSRRAGRRTVRLAAHAVSDMGASHARRAAQRHRRGLRRTAALGLHDGERSHLYLAERLPGRRRDRDRARDRNAVPCLARVDVGRPVQRRLAARRGRRGRSGDPGRHAARHRDLPRCEPFCDDAHRRGAVLAVFGLARPDAREHRARAQLRRALAHPSGRNARRRTALPCALRLPPGRTCRTARLARQRRVARAHGAPVGGRGRGARRNAHRRRTLPARRTCAWGAGSHRFARSSKPARASGSASTAPPPTTARTCSTKSGMRCCCSASRAARRP